VADAIARALGAFCLLFIAACFALIADHREIAMYLLLAGSCFGVSAIAVFLFNEVEFRRIRDGLGELLREGNELFHREITSAENLEAWKADFDSWLRRSRLFLRQELSAAHANIFSTQQIGVLVELRRFNEEHLRLRHTLNDHIHSLRSILERYLAVRR
jgi:hypothetical protein